MQRNPSRARATAFSQPGPALDDPNLGISKIGSQGSLTTTHSEHGASVTEIAALVEVLIKRQPKHEADETRLAKQLAHERKYSAALKKMLKDPADVYVAMSVELEEKTRLIRVTLQSLEAVTAKNRDLNMKIQELGPKPANHSISDRIASLRTRPSK